MNQKTIVLADSSYTIRRIVELSFSEEESVKVVCFENGSNLQEQLPLLKPEIVIVDIKLPEVSGYEICRQINQHPELRHTLVYLMKGGFEPVNEEALSGLQFEDIITKPFDSNVLMQTIMKKMAAAAVASPAPEMELPEEKELMPESMPEEIPEMPEIEPAAVESDEELLSFSELRKEFSAQDSIPDDLLTETRSILSDEVQPSEEITQGAQPSREDFLAPESEDQFINPFLDDDSEPATGLEEPESAPRTEGQAEPGPESEVEAEQIAPPPIPGSALEEDIPKDFMSSAFLDEEEQDAKPELVTFAEESHDDLKPVGIDFPLEEPAPAVADLESQETGPTEAVDDWMSSFQDDQPATASEKISFVDQDENEPFLAESEKNYHDKIQQEEEPETPPEEDFPQVTASPATAEFKVETSVAGVSSPPEIMSVDERDEMLRSIEEKMTIAVKEMLWEILPALAEKMIREEIDKINSTIKES